MLYIWVKNEQSFSVRETTSTVVVVIDSSGYLPMLLGNESRISSLAVGLCSG